MNIICILYTQLIYEVTEGSGTIQLITLKRENLNQDEAMKFKVLGIEIPSVMYATTICIVVIRYMSLFECMSISYTTIVVYSRDHKGVGMAHEIISPQKKLRFLLTTIRQYWLGETKPKQAFRSTQNAFNKLLRNFKKYYLTEFSTD